MSTLQISLPPFSPDYSGAASALFELGGMLILHDGSGCTGNFLGYDEPRWLEHHTIVYCSGLRHVDAILGADEKLVERTVHAVEAMHPRFVAVIGSPVPMLVGCDYHGIAREIEERTHIPCFGFDTTGLDTYDRGVVLACKAALTRWAEPSERKDPRRINLIGLTPFDYGARGNAPQVRAWFEAQGYTVGTSLCMGTTIEEIESAGQASLNIALSESGIEVCTWMQKRYNQPFLVGTPILDGKVMQAQLQGKNLVTKPEAKTHKRVLIFGEQVLSGAIRQELWRKGVGNVTVCTLFHQSPAYAMEGDLALWKEREVRQLIDSGIYTDIIADPLFRPLVRDPGVRFFPLPSVAVSSKLYWDEIPDYQGEALAGLIEGAAS